MATSNKLECLICQTKDVSVECIKCDGPFCLNCDEMYHKHQLPQEHVRKQLPLLLSSLTVDDGIHCCHCHNICMVECKDCIKSFCNECDERYHDHPNLEIHTRKELKRVCSFCQVTSGSVRCEECAGWYCNACDEVRHTKRLENHTRKEIKGKSSKEEIISGLEVKNKELTKSVEEYKTALEQQKVEKEEIISGLEVQNKELTKSVDECKTTLEQQRVEKESLEMENRDLQNQISTLKKKVRNRDTTLQKYLPGYGKEGTWKKYSEEVDGDVIENGVIANVGTVGFVGRAEIEGDVVPGTIWNDKWCHVLHNGEVHFKSPCEMLVDSRSFKWIDCERDEIPSTAVPGGKTKDEEVLYIGRVRYPSGLYWVGKVVPSLNGCYNRSLVFGQWTVHEKYQILVWK